MTGFASRLQRGAKERQRLFLNDFHVYSIALNIEPGTI